MAPPSANTGDSSTGFLSGLKQVLIPDSHPQPPRSHTRTPSQSTATATTTTTQDYGSQAVSNVLVDLAPRLVSSSARMLHPNTIASHQATLAASSSSSLQAGPPSDPKALSLRRKLSYVRAGLALGRPNNPLQSWTDLSTQLYLRDRVDELLALPVPAAPFSLASTSSTTAAAGTAAIEAPPTANNPPRPDDPVPLIQGFLATVPAAQASKAERRRRRAEVSEKALGLSGGTRLGLRQRGERARGLLLDGIREGEEDEDEMSGRREGGAGAPSTIGRRNRARRKPAAGGGDPSASDASTSAVPLETRADLEKDAREVAGDMNNVAVRRALLNGQIKDVEGKIAALEKVREDLRRGLLGLREEELELEDELEGIQSRLQRLPLDTVPALTTNQASAVALGGAAPTPGQHARSDSASRLPTSSSRRRKGPAFLPSEHDDLPPNVAFMTLAGHLSPVIALDFTEPYGTLVSSSSDSSVRLWDLTTGTETGFLKGHKGLVKALQVEGNVCVSGGEDGGIRVWDLDKAEEMFYAGIVPGSASSSSTFPVVPVEEDVFGPTGTIGAGGLVNGAAGLSGSSAEDDGLLREATTIRDGTTEATPMAGETSTDPTEPCMRNLQGHTKAVTSLFFDGPTLVTGSSDSTLRQWDLTTGQCVQTMDILWAISNPLPASSVLYPASSYSHSANDPFALSFSQPGSGGSDFGGFGSASSSPPITPRKAYASSLRRQSSLFESPGAMAAPTTATYADGSWELYDDFVGGVMFWGYALASGTKDGCVRMWDMRTGQAHRTLVGHTGPVTCLQFDEYHLVSGSLDRTIRIWDLRTGAIADTLRYDHAVTSLQFDSRKVVAAAGENGVKVYNRTTMEHSSLQLNGHTAPAEKLRFMDRYLATGGRDAMVKIWALQ